MDGRQHLSRAIARLIDRLSGMSEQERIVARAETHGIAAGLQAAGELTADESAPLLAELDRALAAGPGEPSRLSLRLGPSPALREDMRIDMGASARRTDVVATRPTIPADGHPPPELVRLLPLAGRTRPITGESPLMIGLEIWSTCSVLHVGYPGSALTMTQRLRDHEWWRVTDDVGGDYRETTSYSTDAPGLVLETRAFRPALDARARVLTVLTGSAVDHAVIRIVLD